MAIVDVAAFRSVTVNTLIALLRLKVLFICSGCNNFKHFRPARELCNWCLQMGTFSNDLHKPCYSNYSWWWLVQIGSESNNRRWVGNGRSYDIKWWTNLLRCRSCTATWWKLQRINWGQRIRHALCILCLLYLLHAQRLGTSEQVVNGTLHYGFNRKLTTWPSNFKFETFIQS